MSFTFRTGALFKHYILLRLLSHRGVLKFGVVDHDGNLRKLMFFVGTGVMGAREDSASPEIGFSLSPALGVLDKPLF